ncbi:MAG: hypothetical protein ACRDTG_13535 [Pseudonocardiaceae bacterium]
MRFPNPTAVVCPACGQPTVIAETALGSVRVHCGTWRKQCDLPRTERRARHLVTPAALTAPDPTTDQDLAA